MDKQTTLILVALVAFYALTPREAKASPVQPAPSAPADERDGWDTIEDIAKLGLGLWDAIAGSDDADEPAADSGDDEFVIY